MMWIGYSTMWLATCGVVAYAVHVTENGYCLLALLIPALVGATTRGDAKSVEDKEPHPL